MKALRVQSHAALKQQLLDVAGGRQAPPPDAACPSIESASVLLQLLTPANRTLLATIRDKAPESIAELARLSGRATPNLLRTLDKLAAFGLVRLDAQGRRRIPCVTVRSIRIAVDPFSANDDVQFDRRRPQALSAQ